MARCGPVFIKWGQCASTQSDMFPDSLCAALSELHANAPAHSWWTTKRIVEQSLCIPRGHLHDVFESFDKRPVASGSVAQVHVMSSLGEGDGLSAARCVPKVFLFIFIAGRNKGQ